MGYTIEQQPNQLAGANNPMVYIVKESDGAITGADKFRYIVQVQISTTDASTFSTIAKIKIHKNQAEVGIVDVHKIIRTYLETQQKNVGNQLTIDGSIHSIGISNASYSYSQNTSQVVGVRILGGYEKASSPTTAPVEELAPTGTYTADVIYAIPATTPFTKTADDTGGIDIASGTYANNPMTIFVPGTSTKQFLTNAPTVQFVRGSTTSADNVDELTVGFIQDGLVTDGDPIVRMYIQYYDSAGVVIAGTTGAATSHYFINNAANGGIATADDVKNTLIYFGCGTANLENQEDEVNAQPNNFVDWAYYRIWGANGSGVAETSIYYFYRYGSGASVDDRHQSCTRYNNVRIAWRNRLGCWDYMNFRGKSTEAVDVKRTEMESVAGTWDSADFTYENWDSGRQVLFTEGKRKLVINSDWLNEDEAAWLEELFTSANVEVLADNNIVYPVMVMDKTYTKKTSVNNKIKIQYKISLEYSNKVKTNS